MIKWIKKLFSAHPHVKNMEDQKPKGTFSALAVVCAHCGDYRYTDLSQGREANIIEGLIKFYFVKPEIKDQFIELCHRDKELMSLLYVPEIDIFKINTIISDLQTKYLESKDRDEQSKLAGKISNACGVKRKIEWEHGSQVNCKNMIESLENNYWLKIYLNDKNYLALSESLLKRIVCKPVEEEDEVEEENTANDSIFTKTKGGKIHIGSMVHEGDAPMTQSPLIGSPVLNKEQLEALVANRIAKEENIKKKKLEKSESHWNSLSVSKLQWIPINEKLPSYTKEDYLRQDSLCILRVRYHGDEVDILIGLYCPILQKFRDTDEYFFDNEKSYDDLPEHFSSWDFIDYEITHWMPLSQQHSDNPNTIYFDMPIRGWMGLEAGTLIKFKEPHEINLNDLPWIKPADRLPNYTIEQYNIDESKCLIQIHGEIETAHWFPRCQSFSTDQGTYKPEEIDYWFPISLEAE